MVPINYRQDIGLGEQQLVTIKTKYLNRLIKKKGLNKDAARKLKEHRRTLKNRGYAASCR